MTVEAVMRFIADEKVDFIDLRFCDLPGSWQHMMVPVGDFSASTFQEGVGFDASSIRGWASIHESDMLLMPDPERFWIDPFFKAKTLCLIADAVDPVSRAGYWVDPRSLARRAENYLRSTGIGDTVYFGPEAEFFVFDRVTFQLESHACGYAIESEEAHWSAKSADYHGMPIRAKEGYVPCPPLDRLTDLRSEVALLLKDVGIPVEAHHHEVATAGQGEIDMRFTNLLRMADNLMIFKYTLKNLAHRMGKVATFMPKPLYGDNGNGMHCHQSIWKGEKPLFAGDGYAGLSELALHYAGGLLKHAPAVAAFASPTTNSYKRLVPGFEAPVNLAYSKRNRSAAVRIPVYSPSPKARRLEYRPPDPSCNAYVAFSAMLMAGLDGIQNKIDPGKPLDKDIYELSAEELSGVPSVPGSLEEALQALESDHDFLVRGGVFTEEFIKRWISYKFDKEINPLRMRPSPAEFAMYLDV